MRKLQLKCRKLIRKHMQKTQGDNLHRDAWIPVLWQVSLINKGK